MNNLLPVTNVKDETFPIFITCLCCHRPPPMCHRPPYRTLNNHSFWPKKQLIPRSNIWTENSPPATTSTPSSKHLMTPQFKTVKYNMYYSVFRMVVRQALESIKPLGKEDMQFSWHFFSIVTDWQFDLFMNVFHHSCVHNKWWQKKYCTWTNTRAVLFHNNLLEGVS